MTLGAWVIVGAIAVALAVAFGTDPREPVRALIRRHRH